MQTAIIIGATSGIGRELAVRLHYPFIMPVGADDLHQDTIAH